MAPFIINVSASKQNRATGAINVNISEEIKFHTHRVSNRHVLHIIHNFVLPAATTSSISAIRLVFRELTCHFLLSTPLAD